MDFFIGIIVVFGVAVAFIYAPVRLVMDLFAYLRPLDQGTPAPPDEPVISARRLP